MGFSSTAYAPATALSQTTQGLVNEVTVDAAIARLKQDEKNLDPDKRISAIAPTALPSPLPAANKGEYFLFNAEGTITVATVVYQVNKGDWLWCNTDDTLPNTDANWEVITLPEGRSPFYADPIIDVLTAIPAVTGYSEGDRLLINSTPPQIVELISGAFVSKDFPDNAIAAKKDKNYFYRRVGDEIVSWGEIKPSQLPLIIRAGISNDIDLNSITPHDLDLSGTTYNAYPINFNSLAESTIARGNWSGNYYQAEAKESFVPQISINFAPHSTEVSTVNYVVWEESADFVNWEINSILWQSDRDGYFVESAIVDMQPNYYYRVAVLLGLPATSEDILLQDFTLFNLGRNDQGLIDQVATSGLILPVVIGDRTVTAQNVNIVDFFYPITIQSLSSQPSQIVLELWTAGETNPILTETVTTGINPGTTFNFVCNGIDGFNSGTPKEFYVRAEVS